MPQAQRKVLVVDDDEMVLKFLSASLVTQFEVITTNNPRAVPKICEIEQPALILCDVRMPDLSGAELASLLQKDANTCRIPLVFLTAMVDQQPLERYGSVIGGRPAISKSADLPSLIDFLQQVLAGESPRHSERMPIDSAPMPAPPPSVFVQAEGYTRIQ